MKKQAGQNKIILTLQRILLLVIFFFVPVGIAYSQNDSAIVELFREKMYIGVTNNVISKLIYDRIQNYSENLITGDFGSWMFQDTPMILDSGKIYNISFSRSDLTFPDSSYILVRFSWPGMSFRTFNCSDSNRKSSRVTIQIITGGPTKVSLLEEGLIAINRTTGTMLFVSGYMYLNSISKYFFSDALDSLSLFNYVKLRYYNFSPSDFSMSDGRIRFYSTSMMCYLMLSIQMDPADPGRMSEYLMEDDGQRFRYQ